MLLSCIHSTDYGSKPIKTMSKKWVGEWHKNIWMSDADLEVKRAKNDSLLFYLTASSGANEGQVEGFAII
jgi:hypothetical protein